jgi:hypothetical protein
MQNHITNTPDLQDLKNVVADVVVSEGWVQCLEVRVVDVLENLASPVECAHCEEIPMT